jgi:hypothetical protein
MISYSKSRYTFKENELPTYRSPREDHSDIPSHSTNKIDTSKKETIHYTGDYLIGIATMHKSNAVPVVKGSEMIEATAKMRRG